MAQQSEITGASPYGASTIAGGKGERQPSQNELDGALLELVYLRVSQINGCAFCLEMHSKALRKSGVAQTKLDALAGWRVSGHFSAAEQAALAWAESVTHIASTHAEDDVYLPLLEHFSARQISESTCAS